MAPRILCSIEFLARLAALVPRPRGNLVRYHGILAPNAKYRSAVVPNPSKRTRRRRTPAHVPAPGEARQDEPAAPTAPMTWMERLRRVFAIDLCICPDCGGRLRVIADVTRPDIIRESWSTLRDNRRRRTSASRPALHRQFTDIPAATARRLDSTKRNFWNHHRTCACSTTTAISHSCDATSLANSIAASPSPRSRVILSPVREEVPYASYPRPVGADCDRRLRP